MKSQPKNIAVSIRQRLLNYAKNNKRTFNEILQYYAMERFLYRLSISPYMTKLPLIHALNEKSSLPNTWKTSGQWS
jgi:hypothetical protein